MKYCELSVKIKSRIVVACYFIQSKILQGVVNKKTSKKLRANEGLKEK